MRCPEGFIAIACLTLSLSIPASAANTEPTQGHEEVAPFEGIEWHLLAYQSHNGFVEPLSHSRPTRFHFEAGQFSGSTGCNQLRGAYRVDGAILTIGKGLAMTQMGCPQPLMSQEKAIVEAIRAVATYRLDSDQLALLDPAGNPLLRFALDTPNRLQASNWILDAYHNGKETLAPPLQGTRISLAFDSQGRIAGSDGCNRYMSGYTLDGDTLAIGPIATTRMACRASDGRAEQATAYAMALSNAASYRIEGQRLTLLDAHGMPTARFTAEPHAASSTTD